MLPAFFCLDRRDTFWGIRLQGRIPRSFFNLRTVFFLTWVFQSVKHLPKDMRLHKIRGYAIGIAIGRCCGGSDDKSGSCETNEKYTWTTYSN